jgi:hypothetical protein
VLDPTGGDGLEDESSLFGLLVAVQTGWDRILLRPQQWATPCHLYLCSTSHLWKFHSNPTDTNDHDNNPHENMAYTSSATPILNPIIKDTYSKLLPAPVTRKPSEVVLDQEKWVKLFYARYLNVTATELAISIGTSVQLSGDRAAYRRSKESLTRIWRDLRLRAFEAKSPLSLLVKHKVEVLQEPPRHLCLSSRRHPGRRH